MTQRQAKTDHIAHIRDNWGWAAPALYVYVTGIGMLLSWNYFQVFGIDVFDFAEVNDFLLAAFKEPISLLGVLYTLFYFQFIAWFSRLRIIRKLQRFQMRVFYVLLFPIGLLIRLQRLRRFLVWYYRKAMRLSRAFYRLVRNPVFFLAVAIGAPLAILPTQYESGASIVGDPARRVDVFLRGPVAKPLEAELRDVSFIGNAGQYAFFYDFASRSVVVLPVSNILLTRYPRP